MTSAVAVAGLIFFAGASFFFALAESALFTLGTWQIRQLRGQSPALGGRVAMLLSEPQDLLATIVLGNTLANAAIIATAVWLSLHRDWPVFGALALVLVFILVGGEVIPKTMAVRRPETWAVRVARPMFYLQRASRPARWLAQWLVALGLRLVPRSVQPPQTALSVGEYRELLELACQQGTLAPTEKEIILQIISLDRKTVKDVMKPRAQMACISDDLPEGEMVAAARRFKHRRLPIYDETPDTIVGILNTRALLLNPGGDIADVIEFPSFVPESMNLLQLLKSFQRQQRGLAIVMDEFGGTSGVVTMEDILEVMVGEIRGENEPEGFVMERLEAGRWRVNGTMRLEDFRREYPALGEVPGVETLGGLMLKQLEVVPAAGQSMLFGGLRWTASVVDERRVREILVEALKKR